ncbi:hypothetical protein SAMN05192575_10438 [Nocardioides alpinus]|uniref:Uncharacterized protein n=1 Tax=Nocardioides alpinus TaxID=748909 RepID=A0A1I0YK12_9ACTN|nr:hypothetical protein [Nocardioides alpinus]PKH43576.1 hypothetical protein CXG46_03740 [Nocardioides alpinus]SFB13674.1 hypothetical protein SAMN05192575_10438 [Nocardioides alpinus]
MTSDPGTGLDGGAPEPASRLTARDVALAIGIGLVLAAVLVLVTPGVRTHLLGGTDRRDTTVVAVRDGTRPDEADRPLTTYDLRWTDGDDVRTATFLRSGRPDREVGDSWTLWVAPDGSAVETSSPLATWFFLGIGLPAFVLLIGVVVRWRGRVVERSPIREAQRIEARRARRDPRT